MTTHRCLLILVCILAVFVYQVERAHSQVFFGQFQDDSIYFSTAKALANGQGYTLISFPGHPPQTKYPIVYPWLLSFVWRLSPSFPDNLKLAIRLSEFFSCWSLLATFFLLRNLSGVGKKAALWLTAICAFHPVFVRISGLVMSDMPFMACLLTALAICVHVSSRQAPIWIYVVVGLLAGLSTGIRTLGLALVAGICGALLSNRSYRAAVVVAASAGLVMLLLSDLTHLHQGAPLRLDTSGEAGWNQVVAYYTSYTQFQWNMGIPSLAALIHLVLLNLFVLAASPGTIVFGTFGTIWNFAVTLLSFPMWIGVLRQWRHSEWKPVLLSFVFYLSVILVWPYPQPERFLLPFLPLLIAGLWIEARRIGGVVLTKLRIGTATSERIGSAVVVIIGGVLLAVGAWNCLVRDPRERQVSAATLAAGLQEREQAYQWIREYTKPDDRVVAWKDAVLFLYTGRQSLRPVAPLPQDFYLDDASSEKRDLAHLCDAPRHAGVHYWMTTPQDFNLEPHREALLARMKVVSAALPVVFRSVQGNVEIHDASCLIEQHGPDCQRVLAILFPK